MCDSITNGGPRYGASSSACCPPSNVIIASNVLGTSGDIYASNGTFTGTLTVAGNIVGTVSLSNIYVANSVTATNVFFQNQIESTNLPTFASAQGTWGSSANVAKVAVDQYGRVSTAANIAITSSQWTSNLGNVAYQNGVSIGTLLNPPTGSNLYVVGTATISNVISNGSGLSSLNAANLSGPASLTNLYVANSITSTNVSASGTLKVTGGMTSNVDNTTFFFDTLTIPYINTNYLNVGDVTVSTISNLANLVVSNSVTTGNIFATSGNVTTLNVVTISNLNSLEIVNNLSASNALSTTNVVASQANVGTLNVFQISNLNSLVLGNNLYASNALSTTNIFANGNVVIGPSPATIQSNAHFERSNIFIGNSACVGTVSNSFTINQSTLIFDNTANTSITPNKIVLFSNLGSAGNFCGFGVTGITTTSSSVAYYARSAHIFYSTTTNEVMRINSGSAVGIGTFATNAKLHIGISYQNNVQFRVDSSNIAFVTTLGGLVGINTTVPTANVHILGNVYASNALSTTNVLATSVSSTNPIYFRNRIINGRMTLWQRDVVATSTTPSVYTTADRWCGALGTSGLTLSQSAGPTENLLFPFSLRVATTTATASTPLIEQRIEYLNIPDFLNSTAVTASFWAGQTSGTLMPLTVGLYYATAVNNFGTQTLAVSAAQNTPTLTAANVLYSLTFTLTTALAATNGLSLRFSTGATASAGTFLITGVQVEKGLLATPFEVRPYSTELALSQRYYYEMASETAAQLGTASSWSVFGVGLCNSTTNTWFPFTFPVSMRVSTYALSNSVASNFSIFSAGGVNTPVASIATQADSFSPSGAVVQFNVASGLTAGQSAILRANNLSGSSIAFLAFSSEL